MYDRACLYFKVYEKLTQADLFYNEFNTIPSNIEMVLYKQNTAQNFKSCKYFSWL